MDEVAKLFDLDNVNLVPFSVVTIGYPADGWENKFMDKFDEERIHYEKY